MGDIRKQWDIFVTEVVVLCGRTYVGGGFGIAVGFRSGGYVRPCEYLIDVELVVEFADAACNEAINFENGSSCSSGFTKYCIPSSGRVTTESAFLGHR